MVYKDIWSILGIAPTKDMTEIKKAYAAKARLTNPEDDPEGFEQLHNAYRSALNYARSGARPVRIILSDDDNAPSRTPAKVAQPTPEKTAEQTFNFDPVSKSSSQDSTKDVVKEEAQEPSFDFSPVLRTTSPLIEEIRAYRKTNNISTTDQILLLHKKSRISIVKELTGIYKHHALMSGNTGIWYLYWDEPIVHYFESDPDFRKWVLGQGLPPVHTNTIRAITEQLEKLPPERLWDEKPLKLPGQGLPFIVRKILESVLIMIVGIGVGLVFNISAHNRLSVIELLLVSLACGAVFFIYSIIDDKIDKRRNKGKGGK